MSEDVYGNVTQDEINLYGRKVYPNYDPTKDTNGKF
jgi:hypothetical protein